MHHFDPNYWADFVVEIYFANNKGTVHAEEENLVDQAIALWQRLRSDEQKYWQFKMRQNNIIDREAKEADFQFVKLEATYKEGIGLLLKKGKTITEIAELLDASEVDI